MPVVFITAAAKNTGLVTGALSTIAVAFIGVNVQRSNKKADKRATLREKESLLSLRMMDATLQLSVVTSNALTGGHNNGNVERARETAQRVASEYEEFMRSVTAHEVGK